MRFKLFVLLAACAAMVAVPAVADLQNVETFGSLQIRGNLYSSGSPGLGQGDFTEAGDSTAAFEQRTTLGFSAEFSDDVSAVIQLDNYGIWGDAFRSNAISGTDTGAVADDVALYEAYIEMREIGGYAVNARIGRQEVMLGSEWLVGNNSTASGFRHLSFDGITATYSADSWSVTGAALKLSDNSGMGSVAAIGGIYGVYTGLAGLGGSEEDGDTDLYIVYGSYTGLEDIVIEPYWMYVRSGVDFGLNGIDALTLHTFGARVAGEYAGFDYEGEIAFQSGDTPFGGDYDGLGLNAEVGYTFDHELNPRVFGGFAFFEGADASDRAQGDLGFNRLFSDHEYSEFLDDTTLTNVMIARVGGSIEPNEKIGVGGSVGWFQADEDLTDDGIGIEIGVYGTYQYSDDLAFEAGYAHFLVDDGGEDGNVINGNGLFFVGNNGLDDEDADYFYVQSSISF